MMSEGHEFASRSKQTMKVGQVKIAVLAALMSVGVSLAAADSVPVRNCTWCHGTSAQGSTIAPRLAGQQHQYIENQLLSFSRHTRDNPFSQQYMWGAAANLSAHAARELAAYLSTLPPRPADDGDPTLVALGRTIYEVGIADENVVSCLVCHGPNAEGVGEIPRLGGLAYSYLKDRLREWAEGYHATAWPMPRVANSLSTRQIDALASYLSFVR
jgi:cytochrome c553